MLAHDQHNVFYVASGDRIFIITRTALRDGYRRGVALGVSGGVAPAGESPFNADTAIIELAEFLVLEDGEQRKLCPLDLDSDTALGLAFGPGATEVYRSALELWADYCDAVSDGIDAGLEADDSFRLAHNGGDGWSDMRDAACAA